MTNASSRSLISQGTGGRIDRGWRRTWLAWAILALIAFAAYHNSFSGPFIFDDRRSIPENETIRSLWPLWPVITPLAGARTVCGRPVLNLSFALNYAAGGTNVGCYHAVNLALHIFAGWILFSLARRTLELPILRGRFGADSWSLALIIAGLWVLHPVQTESVTYIVQRAESLAGLFYLMTLYCFMRGITPGGCRLWLWTSVLTCVLGMGSKETVASAPLVAFLYDRTFVAGNFVEAWRRRGGVYVALASTWLFLAYLIIVADNRGGSAGFGIGVSPLDYLLTQGCAIMEYLRLSIWPSPLILDYGQTIITDPGHYLGPLFLVGGLGLAALIAVWRRPLPGFLGFWFFALLAPTSSFVAVASQTMATHRMYLALVPVITAIVLGLYLWRGRKALMIAPLVALVFGWLTFERNKDYRTEIGIWYDTLRKCPGNARAFSSLGTVLLRNQRFEDARTVLEEAAKIDGDNPNIRGNLGIALYETGFKEAGLHELWLAYRKNPHGLPHARNVGLALRGLNRKEEARNFFQAALADDPRDAVAAEALADLDRVQEAIPLTPSKEE